MGEIMTSADKGRKIRDEKIIAMYEKAMGMETKPKLTAVYQRIANEVNVSTVRRHTEAGYLRCGHWRHNGRRFYTGKEILRYYKAQL